MPQGEETTELVKELIGEIIDLVRSWHIPWSPKFRRESGFSEAERILEQEGPEDLVERGIVYLAVGMSVILGARKLVSPTLFVDVLRTRFHFPSRRRKTGRERSSSE